MEVSSPASRPSPAGGLRPALTPAAGTTPRLLPGAAANNFTTRSLQLKSPRIQGRPDPLDFFLIGCSEPCLRL